MTKKWMITFTRLMETKKNRTTDTHLTRMMTSFSLALSKWNTKTSTSTLMIVSSKITCSMIGLSSKASAVETKIRKMTITKWSQHLSVMITNAPSLPTIILLALTWLTWISHSSWTFSTDTKRKLIPQNFIKIDLLLKMVIFLILVSKRKTKEIITSTSF